MFRISRSYGWVAAGSLFFCCVFYGISLSASPALTTNRFLLEASKGNLTAGQNSAVQISGILTRKSLFGPPNFGENPDTDQKFVVWIVTLDHPLVVVAGGDIGEMMHPITTSSIQIKRQPSTAQGYSDLVGRHVVVIGMLKTQVEYDDETPVVIEPSVVRIGGGTN